jgi:tetratricopeptide (TPR) repeat protein
MKREKITIDMEKKDFAFRSYDHILVLYQKKKYEKTMDALHELLALDPDNTKYLSLLDKAKKDFEKQLNKEIIVKIINLQKKFKTEYKKNQKDFIRI